MTIEQLSAKVDDCVTRINELTALVNTLISRTAFDNYTTLMDSELTILRTDVNSLKQRVTALETT